MASTMDSTQYRESGLELALPNGQHFRFADLPAYQHLSGVNLKEMDFAWIDTDKLILLEVRSYAKTKAALNPDDFIPAKNQPMPFRFVTLINKVTDSLMLLLAAWADTKYGKTLQSELPQFAQAPLPLQIIIAIDLPAHLAPHYQALRDSLNAHLRARLALVDVNSIVLLDYARLARHFGKFIEIAP